MLAQVLQNVYFQGAPVVERAKKCLRAKSVGSVMSVKGKKVLHIDRNDHYGGYALSPINNTSWLIVSQRISFNQHRICMTQELS